MSQGDASAEEVGVRIGTDVSGGGGFVEAVAVVAGPGVGTGEGWWGGETSGVAGRSGAGRSGAISVYPFIMQMYYE